MAAVLSRLQSLLAHVAGNGHDQPHWRRDLLVGKAFCRHAADRVRQRLHGLFHNHDAETIAVADAMMGMNSSENGAGN
jgi:hypothetical protein